MAFEIIMPKAGVAMESGTIIEWLKDIGDEIKRGDAILEITTDKVNMEVEAEDDGYLIEKIHEDGMELPVFTVIGYIGAQGEVVKNTSNAVEVDHSKKKVKKAKQNTSSTVSENEYDLVVLGGGPGGYVAAIKASLLGAKVAIVEEGRFGGTCLNRGCIPTKTYTKNVEILETLEKANLRGIHFDSKIEQNIEEIIAYKNLVVKSLTDGVEGLLKSHGVAIYKGVGRAHEDCTVSVSDGSLIKGKKLILSTGSIVRKLAIDGIDNKHVLTSTEMLDLVDVPKELVVIGGGVIGCEFAEIFNSRGSKVTIIEMANHLLPMMDEELCESIESTFETKGIEISLNSSVEGFKTKGKKIEVKLNDGSSMTANKVLFAVGRAPNYLGLEELSLEKAKGFVKVNDKMETSLNNIYAIGDLVGKSMLAHSATRMGEVAACNALEEEVICNLNAVPSAVYTIPEIACVGLTEKEAALKGDYKVGRFNFNGNGRALASGYTDGFIKVISGAYNEILGVHMVGKGVDELINNAAHLIALEIPADEASELIFGHPSLGEILKESLADSIDLCVHLPKK